MAEMVADFVLQRLHAWGVNRIYGYPGNGINGFVGALDRHQEQIQLVQSRHEEPSAFMACAHSKFTGEVGVCMATSGPGAILVADSAPRPTGGRGGSVCRFEPCRRRTHSTRR